MHRRVEVESDADVSGSGGDRYKLVLGEVIDSDPVEVEPDDINESLGKTKDEPNHVNGVVVAVKQVLLGVDHATINKE